MAEFEVPAFLQNRGVGDYMELGRSILPPDIDMSEGSHAWNFIFFAAAVAAELCEYALPEAIKVIIPDWSYGEYLVGHGKARGIYQHSATAASGEITINGLAGAIIPEGSLFSTSSVNDEPSVDYATVEDVTIPESGTVTVKVLCTQVGIIGNTGVATVIHVGSKLDGITSVTNEKVITGGTEVEDDESLQERIRDYDESLGESYIGNPADYKRWAEEVDGVGAAVVISAKDTSGLVTIVVTDANGEPANESLRTAVYNHIMSPDDDMARLAPPNANLLVVAPSANSLSVKATVELKSDTTLEAVTSDFLAKITAYLPEAMSDGELRYTRITRELSNVSGVYDYSNVQIGIITDGSVTYGTANIQLPSTLLPSIKAENLLLTVGTVV